MAYYVCVHLSSVGVFMLEGHVSHYFVRYGVIDLGLAVLNGKVGFVVGSHSELLSYQMGWKCLIANKRAFHSLMPGACFASLS